MQALAYKKSSFSVLDNCVSVAVNEKNGDRFVRHTSQPEGAVLAFNASEWDAFVRGVKDGQFDV